MLITPDDAALEKWAVGAIYSESQTEPKVRVGGSSDVLVPVSGGGSATVFSKADTDVKLEQDLDLVGLNFVCRPKQLRYNFSVAQVRRFDLDFSSGSLTNSLRADSGFRAGFGIAGSFVPVSVASVGLGWSLDYKYLRADLNRFESNGVVSSVSQRFEQDEFQAAVIASWRWKLVQPYGGLKIQRRVTRLTDRGAHESISGTADGVSPTVGLEWMPFPGECGVVEGSFVDEKSVTASWVVKF